MNTKLTLSILLITISLLTIGFALLQEPENLYKYEIYSITFDELPTTETYCRNFCNEMNEEYSGTEAEYQDSGLFSRQYKVNYCICKPN